MAFVGKSFSLDDTEGSEKSPAADEAGLSGREADLFDGEEAVVMEDVAVDQGCGLMECLAGLDGEYCSGSWEVWRDG